MESFKNTALTVIGGVGYDSLSEDGAARSEIKTPYGTVSVSAFSKDGSDIVFISRHQGKQHVPPHKINFLALVDAARQIGAPVLSVNSVGLMRSVPLTGNFETKDRLKDKPAVSPENFLDFPFFVPTDFVDLTKNRISTFHDEDTVHVDMTDPYCVYIRSLLYGILKDRSVSYSEGVYLCTEGPRFETKAEIQMFAHYADVVGMTGIPEVVLAKEAGLCYASFCTITNPATSLSGNMVTADEVTAAVEKNQKTVFEIIFALASVLSDCRNHPDQNKCHKNCRCQNAVVGGKL
ncbi:S-methyl-5'-thioinosine phosphorylase [Methanimicrococcus sp. At1]|uniref:S-methyl-5'-thioinosine phosphorylase n=1 Tax=Methanimicrococcus hacksteinii TaxID=3028293 RepID=A0ABU3VNV3_9EURY|nr:MTAP family purine nucleoside phosphorylase [Methanimicrococcus sp. At1]MDV0444984.1 S-methyl-5'-thioinosine phosphorylase [Methanimicrococcus sp. At1]